MAKIDTSKIAGYDGMTAEEKLKALEEYEYDDGAGEIERYKNAVSKANSEAAEWRKKHNALLSEEDQKKQASDEAVKRMEQELADLRREKMISEHKAQFTALGYDEALAAETATAMADGDLAKVFANQKTFLTAHDKQLKADAMKGTPAPPPGNGGKPVTRESIMAIRDSGERQAAIKDNIQLFTEE